MSRQNRPTSTFSRPKSRHPMGRHLLAMVLALGALASLAAAQMTRPAEPISDRVRQQFTAFCRAVDAPPAESPDLKRAPTWVQAATDDWIFTIDLTGNRSLRRVPAKVQAAASMPCAATRLSERLRVPPAVRTRLIDDTRRLATTLARVPASQGSPHLKQEIVLICWRDKNTISRYPGRYFVRLNDLPGRTYFQVLYGPDQKPVRIETNVRDSACARLADAIADRLPDPSIPTLRETREPLAVGTWFMPGEYRFEIRTWSFEGESFLELSQRKDPYGLDHFEPPKEVDVAAYRQSKDFHHYAWLWWTRYGRVGAVRGNWDPQAKQWEHPKVEIRFHRSLADYPLKTAEHDRRASSDPDGKEQDYPNEQFTSLFYEDLERCHVAYICSHGGHVGRRFRFARDPHVWIKFEPPADLGLGQGNLRHLFFEGCGGMTWLAEPNKPVLLDTWIQCDFIRGVRTICGHDGGHSALDRTGWRFYGRYNKGDTIGDAWALGNIDEGMENNPVTIAYGQTRQEAIETLKTGRFTTQPADPKWAAVSLWGEPADSPR